MARLHGMKARVWAGCRGSRVCVSLAVFGCGGFVYAATAFALSPSISGTSVGGPQAAWMAELRVSQALAEGASMLLGTLACLLCSGAFCTRSPQASGGHIWGVWLPGQLLMMLLVACLWGWSLAALAVDICGAFAGCAMGAWWISAMGGRPRSRAGSDRCPPSRNSPRI